MARIVSLLAIGFAVGLAYTGALLAFDVGGLAMLVAHAGPGAALVFLLGGAFSFMPIVIATSLVTRR